MDLGTAPLFDLTAPAAVEAVGPVAVTRSQELLASIQQRRTVITDQEIATSARSPNGLASMPSLMRPTRRR